MSKGVRLLLEKDYNRACEKAEELNMFNKRRKELEVEMMDSFKHLIENFESDKYGVCVYDPTGHEGVIGIVASRVKEKLNRPAICFADTHEAALMREKLREAEIMGNEEEITKFKELFLETYVKGSARSVPGVHLKHTLDEIKVKYPHIGIKGGGHAMAAGLSVPHRHFEEFQNVFDSLVRKHLTPEMIKGEVLVDKADFPAEWMTLENAQVLRSAGPWGQKFEQPLFAKRMEVVSFKPLNGGHLKLKLRAPNTDVVVDAICFKCLEDGEGDNLSLDFVDVAFTLDVNEFRGRVSLQLMVDHIEKSELNLNNTNEGAVKVGYLGASKQQKKAQQNLMNDEEFTR
jgi:single-stranded-DNA-specific exonuclease